MGVKMVGLFTVITIGIAVIIQLWEMLDIKKGNSLAYLGKHFAARVACLIILPLALYLSFFWLHFAILHQSGTGDAFMTPLFQMQLEGSPLTQSSIRRPFIH
jgi:dolichyl-phosphate-mannose-protein mannosyltransferase